MSHIQSIDLTQGGVIQSSQQAIADGNNTLITGTLTQSDIKNHDDFSADGFSVGASYATAPANKDRSAMLDENGNAKPAVPGGSAGIGSDSGNKNSTTVSGISGGTLVITNDAAQLALTGTTAEQTIASVNRDVDSSKDSSGALIKAWNGDALRQDVQAQATITAAFGAQASKLVGDYADRKRDELATEARNETDADKKAVLLADAKSWDEGQPNRVAAHIAVGLLGGGLQGAMGAGASAALASSMNSLLGNSTLPDSLKSAVGAALASAVGAAAGGAAGAAAGFNGDVNNRQIHEDGIAKEKTLAKNLAGESNGRFTQAQVEDALRSANNKDLGETIQTGAAVPLDANTVAKSIYDRTGMVLVNDGQGNYSLVQNSAMLQTPSEELRNYIQANTGDTYSWSNVATAGPVSTALTSPFIQGWNTGNYSAGLPADTTAEQRQENMANFTDKASTGTGLAAIWAPPPIDLALVLVSGAFKASNYLLSSPSYGTIKYDAISIIVPAAMPQGPWVQTVAGIGFAFLQPIVTPALEQNNRSSTQCSPPKKC